MRILKSILAITMLAFVAVSCSDNDDVVLDDVVAKKIENLYAPGEGRGNYTGEFTKFSFKEGKQVTGDNWDIAFRATEIIVNGGKKGALLEDIDRTGNASMMLLSSTSLQGVTTAPAETELKQDSEEELVIKTGSDLGWYTYNQENHTIAPIAGKVIVVKTIDGNYAKMEILSYYKDSTPSLEGSKYYTFNYVYNPNIGDTKF